MTTRPPLARLDGKTVIVTGASDGIGVETARALANLGATLVLPARNLPKAESVKNDLVATTGNANITVMPLDLADLASIRAFTAAFCAAHPRLDVLVNNAGVVTKTLTRTVDGFETTFGVNHLGTFALTLGLLEPLRAAAPSRVVIVSSTMHKRGTIPFDDLLYERHPAAGMGGGAYADSKLANVLFAYELAARLSGTGVTVNALHPGVVSTALARGYNAVLRWLAKTLFISPEKGARTSVYLAASPVVAGVTGKYFAASAEKASSAKSHDVTLRKQLWDVSEKLTGATWA